jgi:hypothetical protein
MLTTYKSDVAKVFHSELPTLELCFTLVMRKTVHGLSKTNTVPYETLLSDFDHVSGVHFRIW